MFKQCVCICFAAIEPSHLSVSFSIAICRRYNVGVSEHFAMAMEPLPNLSEQSARIGMWLLSVATDARVEEYTYTKGTGKGKGKKFEVLLVSDDSDAYCLGQFRKKRQRSCC